MARTANKSLVSNGSTTAISEGNAQFQQLQMQQLKHYQDQQQYQQAFVSSQYHPALHYPTNFNSGSTSAHNVAAAHSLAVNLVANAAAMNNNGTKALAMQQGPSASQSADSAANQAFNGYVLNGSLDCENIGERVKGKRRKYCPHEVTALITGVQRYADESCPWSSILRDPILGPLFHGRSGVDLKDKWRTLIKTKPELSIYTENRKNHRKYRPFTPDEERALLEGVKRYHGQRNVWSLILADRDLGLQFNDRTNVQLKDKYRTMKRSGSSPTMFYGSLSNRRHAGTNNTNSTSESSNTNTPSTNTHTSSNSAKSECTTSNSGNAAYDNANRPLLGNAQQVANYLMHNNNISALFADPNLYLGGSLALQPQQLSNINLQQMAMANNRQQHNVQAQAHAQAQAQAQALAQYQAQIQAQQHQTRNQNQNQIKQQPYQGIPNNPYQLQTVQGYQLIGNQLIPHQLYYQMPSNASRAQQQQFQQQQYMQHQQRQAAQAQAQAQVQALQSDQRLHYRNTNSNTSRSRTRSRDKPSEPVIASQNWSSGPVSPPMESILNASINAPNVNSSVSIDSSNYKHTDPKALESSEKSEAHSNRNTNSSNDKSLISCDI